MRMLLIYILFVAFGCQQTTFLETENLKTSKSELETENLKTSKSEKGQKNSQVFSFSDSQIQHYENQIRLADSLYKNYLPQYNFEEVKKAVEFLESENLKTSETEKRLKAQGRKDAKSQSDCLYDSATLRPYDPATAYRMSVDRCPLSVDIEYLRARAHYYHAVGLTERDDIVGACEHYFKALEIMETELETENLKTSKSEKRIKSQGRKVTRTQGRKDAGAQSSEAQSSQLEVQNVSQFFSFSDSQILNNPEDYEKIRFLALTYTRLGRLFYDENYCDLAILKYKKALNCLNIIKDSIPISYTYKTIGNVYQLLDKTDSALYHYRKSLEIYSGMTNKLDIEKNIAQILFERGEKNNAYIIIKNNLDKIENTNVRYSYYNILGKMYMDDKEYDSAVYYLTKSINSNIPSIKVNSAIKLSAIYDSIGDYEKKAYYDGIISKISINDVNKRLKNNKIQDVYDKYKERKAEKEKIKSRTRTKFIAISLSLLIIVSFVIIILIWHKSKRKDRIHQESLNEKDRYIANKEEIISRTNEEIKRNESEIKKLVEIIGNLKSDINSLKDEVDTKEEEISCKENDIKKMENDLSAKEMELEKLQKNVHENSILIDRLSENHKTNEELMIAYIEEIEKLKTEIDETRNNLRDIRFRSSLIEGKINSKNIELQKKEEEINRYKLELSEYKNKLEIISSDISDNNYTSNVCMESYLQSKICSKILNEINDLSARNKDVNILTPLKPEELIMLLNSASLYVNNFTNGIVGKYSKLKKEDLYYLSLAIIGLKDKQISSLLGVTYNSIRIRKKNLCSILGIKNDELQSFLMNVCS